MSVRAVFPPGVDPDVLPIRLSPGIVSHGHLFLTGLTGSLPDGTMPSDPEVQFRQAFDKIAAMLAAAGTDFGAVVEMTSYHIGLAAHFTVFEAVHAEFVRPPYPAWTAVEVAGLRRKGALAEIRVIAQMPE